MAESPISSSSSDEEESGHHENRPSSHSGLSGEEDDTQQRRSSSSSSSSSSPAQQRAASSSVSSDTDEEETVDKTPADEPHPESAAGDAVPSAVPAAVSAADQSSLPEVETTQQDTPSSPESIIGQKRRVLGSATSSDNEEANGEPAKRTVVPEISDSEGEGETGGRQEQRQLDIDEYAEQRAYEDEEIEEPPQPPIESSLPMLRGPQGPVLTRMPNFLSVETHPFNPATYDEDAEDEVGADEEGRTRLHLRVENCIRWRPSAEDEEKRESNTKIVKWSDGSMTLHVGSEAYEVIEQRVDGHNQLFLRLRSGLLGSAIFKRKLNFRPLTTDSMTHKKMTLTLAEKTNRSQRVKMIMDVGQNPEIGQLTLIKQEEERIRANARREAQQRRAKERQFRGGVSHGFLEERDDYEDEHETAARRIPPKNRFDAITSRFLSDEEESDDDSRIGRAKLESDDEEDAAGPSSSSRDRKRDDKRPKRRVVISDDEDD